MDPMIWTTDDVEVFVQGGLVAYAIALQLVTALLVTLAWKR